MAEEVEESGLLGSIYDDIKQSFLDSFGSSESPDPTATREATEGERAVGTALTVKAAEEEGFRKGVVSGAAVAQGDGDVPGTEWDFSGDMGAITPQGEGSVPLTSPPGSVSSEQAGYAQGVLGDAADEMKSLARRSLDYLKGLGDTVSGGTEIGGMDYSVPPGPDTADPAAGGTGDGTVADPGDSLGADQVVDPSLDGVGAEIQTEAEAEAEAELQAEAEAEAEAGIGVDALSPDQIVSEDKALAEKVLPILDGESGAVPQESVEEAVRDANIQAEVIGKNTVANAEADAQEAQKLEVAEQQVAFEEDAFAKALREKGTFRADENRWWNSRSTGQKLAAIFAVALNSWAEGYQGKLGISSVLQNINDTIDKDIQSQKDFAKQKFDSAKEMFDHKQRQKENMTKAVLDDLAIRLKQMTLKNLPQKQKTELEKARVQIENVQSQMRARRVQTRIAQDEFNLKKKQMRMQAQALEDFEANPFTQGPVRLTGEMAQYPTSIMGVANGKKYNYYAQSKDARKRVQTLTTAWENFKTTQQSINRLADAIARESGGEISTMDRFSAFFKYNKNAAKLIALEKKQANNLALINNGGGRLAEGDEKRALDMYGSRIAISDLGTDAGRHQQQVLLGNMEQSYQNGLKSNLWNYTPIKKRLKSDTDIRTGIKKKWKTKKR